MDAKETIKYIYGHRHIPSSLHFKTIMDELEKPITEHPDVQNLIGKHVQLQAKYDALKKSHDRLVKILRKADWVFGRCRWTVQK